MKRLSQVRCLSQKPVIPNASGWWRCKKEQKVRSRRWRWSKNKSYPGKLMTGVATCVNEIKRLTLKQGAPTVTRRQSIVTLHSSFLAVAHSTLSSLARKGQRRSSYLLHQWHCWQWKSLNLQIKCLFNPSESMDTFKINVSVAWCGRRWRVGCGTNATCKFAQEEVT